jgi:type IV pilus assembly protein PilQ
MVIKHIATIALCSLALGTALAQDPAPIAPPKAAETAPAPTAAPATPDLPAPISPPVFAAPQTPAAPVDPALQAPATTAPAAAAAAVPVSTVGVASTAAQGNVIEFQQEDVGLVFRTLARQAKINLIISDKVTGSGQGASAAGTVTTRLENIQPLQAMEIIASSKNLIFEQQGGVYYVKTADEKQHEPLLSANYTLSYAQADKIAPLLASQLQGGGTVQIDTRTNTIFYRETKSNLPNIKLFLETVDRPTQQVMIEARLVEVNANPKQSYGINWAGVVGSSTSAQTVSYGGYSATSGSSSSSGSTGITTGPFTTGSTSGNLLGSLSSASKLALGQVAILSVPQMSITLRALNEDADAEFLANPRVVTASNQEATIKITRNQPVPQLNFNEQTATAVFGGFQDKIYGNTLKVLPIINKDKFISLNVQPEISNKVADETFVFSGATVSSPIIDTRTLNSNVVIKSGDTLAIGGLLQDEVTKGRNKVPILGDIPVVGYAFQERLNTRTKRNLLIFVTPTIIKQGYGTGLESQVTGLQNSGEEYADPNGWRNNAKGAYRLTPTSNRQVVSDYPVPGAAPAPDKVNYKVNATDREQ